MTIVRKWAAHRTRRDSRIRSFGLSIQRTNASETKTKEEAIELTRRFLKVHGDEWDIECELRELDGPDFGSNA